MTRLLTTILFFCLLQLAFSQDIVVLRNGSRLEGKILNSRNQQIILQHPDREEPITLPRRQVRYFKRDHQTASQRIFSLDLFLGSELISPASGIEKTLIEQRFDQTANFNFLGLFLGSREHPKRTRMPSCGFGINWMATPRSEFGMDFSFQGADIDGYNVEFGFASLKYRTTQLIPAYRRYAADYHTYWEVGAPLSFFKLEETMDRSIREIPAAFRPGLQIGGGLLFFRTKSSALQVKMSYSLALPGFDVPELELRSRIDAGRTIKLFEGRPIQYHSLKLGVVYSFRFNRSSADAMAGALYQK